MKTPLKAENYNTTFYEAIILKKATGAKKTLTEDTLPQLHIAIDIWTKCGEYEVTEANKVERELVRFVDEI